MPIPIEQKPETHAEKQAKVFEDGVLAHTWPDYELALSDALREMRSFMSSLRLAGCSTGARSLPFPERVKKGSLPLDKHQS